jgi:hypothetical protein
VQDHVGDGRVDGTVGQRQLGEICCRELDVVDAEAVEVARATSSIAGALS